MKTLIHIVATMLFLLSFFTKSTAQSHIDNNYNYGYGPGQYLERGPGKTKIDYITMLVRNDNSVMGKIHLNNPFKIIGSFTGTIGDNAVIHGTITWTIGHQSVTKTRYFQMYKLKALNQFQMAFYENNSYKTNNRVRSNVVFSFNSEKTGAGAHNKRGNTKTKTLPK